MSKLKTAELFEVRKLLRQYENKFGKNLDENERAILGFIASRKGTRITDICNEGYFENLSLSTIKRCVASIKKNKLVKIGKSYDKRDRPMSVSDKVIL